MKQMIKKGLDFLLMLMIVFGIAIAPVGSFVLSASAASYVSGEWTYELISGNARITQYSGSDTSVTIPSSLGGYTVTGINKNAFKSNQSIVSLNIGTNIEFIGESSFEGCTGLRKLTIPDNVLSLGASAFKDCTSLQSITIGTGIWTIPKKCFSGCRSLDSVSVGYDVEVIDAEAFKGCTALYSIQWGGWLDSIGQYAFQNCISLPSLTIPDSVYNIDNYAFDGCNSIFTLNLGSGVDSIGKNAFSNCTGLRSLTIPDNVTVIGEAAFKSCTGLGTVRFGTGVQTIPAECFNGCSKLKTLTIGDNVTNIGKNAFLNCSTLFTINWGSSLHEIGEYAFMGCTSLSTLTIPDTVITIGESAFEQCKGITTLNLGNNLKTIRGSAFRNCSGLVSLAIPDSVEKITKDDIFEGTFQNCTSLKTVRIGSSVQEIPAYCFDSCSSLTSLIIGEHVTKIDYEAFMSCGALSDIQWGNDLKEIGSWAFLNCVSLSSLTIPDSVTMIDNASFQGCSGLTSLTLSNRLKGIASNAFWGCTGLTSLTIPSSVTTISVNSFGGCSNISTVYLDIYLQSVSQDAFDNTGITDVYYAGSIEDREYLTIDESGNNKLINAMWHYNWVSEDTIQPAATISATEAVSSSQTVTLAMTDNAALAGYYWGTSISYADNPYITVPNFNAYTVYETVSSAGTYYLTAKDTSGNISTTAFQTFFETVLDAKGGSVTPERIVSISGSSFVLPEPYCMNNTFETWSTKSDGSGTTYNAGDLYQPSENTTLYAVWQIKPVTTYTVTYNANGGSGAPAAQSGATTYTIPNTIPTRSGYDFLGWSISSTATVAAFQPGGSITPTANTTLYAVWQIKPVTTYTVTYNANGGSGAPAAQSGAATYTIPNTIPTRSGYDFLGWSSSSTAATASFLPGGSITPTANTTLYAVWQIVPSYYTVTFDAKGGSVTPSFAQVEKGRSVTLPTPQKTGAACLGWSTSVDVPYVEYLCGSLYTPGSDITLYAVWKTEEPKTPVVDIEGYVSVLSVKYETTVMFHVSARDLPSGTSIRWYVNGTEAGQGTDHTVNYAKSDFTVQVKAFAADGSFITESRTESVSVKNTFFTRLGALFRRIFGLPRVYDQR